MAPENVMELGVDYKEFTEASYRRLLRIARENYHFTFFDQTDLDEPFVLWRHDVDLSIHRALRLAEIEKEEAVSSTFFLLLHGHYYNLFEREVYDRVQKILSFGHRLGLHFDFNFYDNLNDFSFEEKLQFEKTTLENLFGAEVSAVSYHNPSPDLLKSRADLRVGGLFNAYAKEISDKCDYASDSNGYWRFRSIEEALLHPKKRNIQVLTHPEWWTADALSPRERVSRCIDGRANFIHQRYDKMIENHGRKNIR